MISKKCFTEEWILEVKGNERSDQSIIEKQIYALHLLEELNIEFSYFIFKGGTALSLISDTFPRFSVDIDILVEPRRKEFFTIKNLDKIISHSEFKSVEENYRQPKHNIDKQHFEFYYDGVYGENLYILLDVVYAKSNYSDISLLEVKNRLIDIEGIISKVQVPSIHDLLSDKLCAFAPSTIGKKLGDGRDVEVIKQMYDVAYLFDHYPLNPTFHSIYKAIASQEIENRNLIITYKETAVDTILTSLNIITEGKIEKKQYPLLRSAIRRFGSFVRDYSFNVEKAKLCAINNLYAALLVLTEGSIKFDDIVKQDKDYSPEYRIFIPTKRWLRLTNPDKYDLFDNCLKVMSYLEIQLK